MHTKKKSCRASSVLVVLLTFALAFSLSVPAVRASAAPALSAKHAVLIDFDSGEVLLEHNAKERAGMASTTKIMTALTVLSLCKPTDKVVIAKEAVGVEGSSIYLCEGESLSVEQLLYALLLSSANDAATALAVHCSGSVEKFAVQMNTIAASLGLSDTHFVNPHGLYDENHYTTAYDLAVIARAALQNELLRTIFATYKKTIPMSEKHDARLLVNHNKLLRTYDGAIGMKTGFTKKTGRCLVSAATRDGLTLIAVTLCAPDDWRDHTAMLDFGFDSFERVCLADIGEYKISMPLVGTDAKVLLANTKALYLTLPKNHAKGEYTVSSCHRFIYEPVKESYVYATLCVRVGDKVLYSPMKIYK